MYRVLSRLVCRTSVARFVLLPLFVWLSLNTEATAQNFWQQTSGPYEGHIEAFAINANGHIFAGTSGDGVLHSMDNGASWTQVNAGLTNTFVRALAINGSGHIFAGTFNDGVFRSTNNGNSWAQVNTGLTNTDVRALAINASGHIFAGTFVGGVYRSTNNGDSWTKVDNGLRNTSVETLAINASGQIFAGISGGLGSVFRSTNNGDSWTAVNTGLTSSSVQALAINASGHIFAGTFLNGMFRSTNEGDSWAAVNTGLTNTNVFSLAINASGHIFAGTSVGSGVGGAFRSTNNGNSWTEINTGLTHPNVNALAINTSGHVFAGTAGGGMFHSTNGGDSWTAVNTGLTDTNVQVLAINSSGHIFAGIIFGAVFRSTNDGDSWTAINTGLTNNDVGAFAINASGHIFAGTGGGGVFRSTNNGDSWTQVNTGLTNTRVQALAINTSGHIFAGTLGGVFRSTNNGDSWTQVNTGLTNTRVQVLAINTSGHIFAGPLGGVFRSMNNGDGWTEINTGLTNSSVYALTINASGHIFAGTLSGVFRSTNNGDSWTRANTGLTNTDVRALAINASGHTFAGTASDGVFRSTNNGDSWTAVNNGLTNTAIYALAINSSGQIFAGTLGGGVFRSVQSTTGSMAHFTAQLTGAQEVPSVSTTATGTGSFRLNASQTELQFNITVCNLTGLITFAHFHNAPAGINASVVRDIKLSFNGNTASGVWKSTDNSQPLTPALVDSLLSGRIYVNIHTAANPGGEIRGQLNLTGTGFTASLNAAQQVPSVAASTTATGTGSFSLNAAMTELQYDLTVCDLTGPIAAAHFHLAQAGKAGPVIRSIDFAGKSTASGIWRSTDTSQPLTPAFVDSLLNGKVYVNIFTAANSAGEIRGQLIPSSLRTPVPIALARTIPDFTSDVTIEGVITTVDFQLSSASNGEFYLQDATGGIRMFSSGGKIAVSPGTLIRIKNGAIGTDPSGRKNIETVRDSIVVLGSPGLPAPKITTVDSYLKNRIAFEGQYIGIRQAGITSGTWPAANANSTLTINDGSGSLAMFIDLDTNIDGTAQPVNPFDVFGIATHFNGTPQIQPSSRSDFVESNNQAPSAPTLASPAINAFTNDNTPNLTFNVPEDANGDPLHFQVEIDDDGNFGVGTQIYESKSNASGFSPTPPVAQGSAQMTYTAQTALAEDDWWWRVSAWDGKVYGNPSPPRKFIVDLTKPFTSDHNPSRSATGVPINTNIVVHVQDAKSGVKRSNLVMRVNGNAVSPSITGAASDYTLTYDPPVDFGLQQTVAVSIDAADSAGNALTADSYTFTTGGNSAPAAPTLVSFATNPFTTDNTPALTFNVPQDVNGDPLHFSVEIDDDGDFGVVTHTFESRLSTSGFSPMPPVAQGNGQATYNVQSALADGDWWWRVSAWDGRVYGNSPAARRFVVDVTKPFTSNHNPSDSAKGISINTNIVVHVQDATSGVKRSSLVMKVNGNAVSPSITGTSADYTLTYDPPNNFAFGQTVNVSIDAADSTENALTTDAYSFTIGANSAPSAPTLLATANPFTNDNTPDLAFNVPSDANDDPLHFRVEIDDDGNFNSINYFFESQSRTSGFSPTPPVASGNGQVTYTVQTTLTEGNWWWRVSAWDGRVYGNPSAARKFIVDISPPQINNPLRISERSAGQSTDISAEMRDNFAILAARVYYRKGGASAYASTVMVNAGGDEYEGTIPDTAITVRGAEYYFAVEDSAKNMRTFPVSNPRVIQVTTNNLIFSRATPAKAYRMISVPLKLNDETVRSVLEEDDLGNYDDTQWRLLRYVNGVNVEYGSPEFAGFSFKPGSGFWLITRESKTLDAGAGRSLTTAQSFIINNIPPGWSQIGNPFAFTVNWSEVIKGANVEDKLVGYQGSSNEATGYDYNRTQLVPFEGYFVNNKGSSPTTLEILPKAASSASAKLVAADWKSALRGSEWAVQITAECGNYLDKDNYLGVLNNASDEWDANDFSEAPFFDQHVALYFPHPEWKKYPDLYTGDFRAVKPEGDYWDFVVRSEVTKSEVARSEVVLKLAEVRNLPAEWEVVLLDRVSHFAVNLREQSRYTFFSRRDEAIREFRIVVGPDDFVETHDLGLADIPKDFVLEQNFPNPFNPETAIRFGLPQQSMVTIKIFDLAGREIATLLDDFQLPAGLHQRMWDGRDAQGRVVVSGIYFYQLIAGNFFRTMKMALVR